jgi:DNA segregation ATPase FtsK/SpoIIIE-like protein
MLDISPELKRGKLVQKHAKIASKWGSLGLFLCIFSLILGAISAFMTPYFVACVVYGLFGVYAFALLFLTFFAGISLKFSRRYGVNLGYIICSSIMLGSLLCAIHIIATRVELGAFDFGKYIDYAFENITPGGALFAVPSFVLWNIFAGAVGAAIVLSATFLISAAFLTTFIVTKHGENRVIHKKPQSGATGQMAGFKQGFDGGQKELNKQMEQKYQELLQKQSRTALNAQKSRLGLDKLPINTVPNNAAAAIKPNPNTAEEINQMSTIAAQKFNAGLMYSAPQTANITASAGSAAQIEEYNTPWSPPTQSNVFNTPAQKGDTYTPEVENMLTEYKIADEAEPIAFSATTRARQRGQNNVAGQTSFGEVMENTKAKKAYKPHRYVRPTIDMIKTESTDLTSFHTEAAIKQGMLDQKLQEFNVNAKVTGYTVAPAITRFEVSLGTGTRANDVYRLESDFQVILGTTNIRMENVNGKNAIGIEVPNKSIGCVSIVDILKSRDWLNNKSPLAVAIGKNINDEIVVGDIGTMPHLLVAGSTGSGKSVCINTILTSLIYRTDPADLKLLLVDMKLVELGMYNEIPHMLIPHSIGEVQHAINALKWMQDEMQRRYKKLQEHGLKHVSQYQALPAYQSGQIERMPYILMVIDEAADLIYSGKRDVEDAVKRLAALGRASGIHLILATQRPSVDVITAVIKANLPVRIGFKTISNGDSRTIINEIGCEKLVGRGDMLFSREGKIMRIQGAYIDDEEARRIMNFIRENNKCEFDTDVEDYILNGPPLANVGAAGGFGDGPSGARNQDPAFLPILRWLVRDENTERKASIAGVQRTFSLGFGRAGRIIDQMTQLGYVSEDNGQKGRMVIITKEEVDNLYGPE